MKKKWVVYKDASTVAQKACQLIKEAADIAIDNKGIFRIVLAGGSTPEQIYQLLAKQSYDWSLWEFYLGDERCLPVDSIERNSQMIMRSCLNDIEVPAENIYFIPAERGAEQGAEAYAETIQHKMPFDMVLLGMGEDGHTASLFPQQVHREEELVHAVHDAPKAPSDRVSLSASSLSHSAHVLMVVTGSGKKHSVAAWKNGEALPIAQVSALTQLTVMLDEKASPTID